MNKIENISVVIIAKNAQKTIKNCLSRLDRFNNVVLYLNDSTDLTNDIAASFSNVSIFHGGFEGYAKTKKKALTHALNDWVLSIDSDEFIDDQLVRSLENLILSNDTVYKIRRINFYKKKKINFSGIGNEYVIRLFNKNNTNFNSNLVHESIQTKNQKIKLLKGTVNHYTYSSISHLIQKTDYYSSLYAQQNIKFSSPLIAVLKSIFYFFKNYFIFLGFLDGYEGLLICYSGSNEVFYKYLKLYEKNKGK